MSRVPIAWCIVIACDTTPPVAPSDVPLTLALDPTPQTNYIPAAIAVPATFTLSAPESMLGAPLTLTSSLGAVSGPATIAGNVDAGVITTEVVLSASGAEGVAEVIAQAAGEEAGSSVTIVGPLVLSIGSAALPPDVDPTEVFVSSNLPPPYLAASIAGCTADSVPGVSITTGSQSLAGTGLTQLATCPDGTPCFDVAIGSNAIAGTSAQVACFDRYGQRTAGVYTVVG